MMVGTGGTGGGASGDVAFSAVVRLVFRGISFGVVVSTAAFLTDAAPLPLDVFDFGVLSSAVASMRFSLEDRRGVGAVGGVSSRSDRMSWSEW